MRRDRETTCGDAKASSEERGLSRRQFGRRVGAGAGALLVGVPQLLTYTVENTGVVDLELTSLTIENADKIVVLKDGGILAAGTHGHLLDACPFYRDFYRKQFSPAPELSLAGVLAA